MLRFRWNLHVSEWIFRDGHPLSYAEDPQHWEFIGELLAVFPEGKRLQKGGRSSDAGCQRKVEELENRFRSLRQNL